jgi:uncharacterized protein (TIGR03435 family)
MRADTCRRAILLLPIVAVVGLHAQQTISPRTETFEVASVKVNKSGERSAALDFAPDRARIRNYELGRLLMKAFNISNERQLSNPGSFLPILNERYDIDAKAAHPVDRAELLQMLQGLLTDRFKLAMHRETKEVSGYALVVDPGGKKLRPHVGEGGECGGSGGKDGEIRFQNCGMDYLATFALSTLIDKFVADKTGLKGGYDFELLFSREMAANPGENRPTATVINPDAPSIFTAVREQLGLRLNAEKVTVEFFGIDHLERPSEN